MDERLIMKEQEAEFIKVEQNPNDQVSDDPLIGSCLDGRYRLESTIGSGGFSFVYKATHLLLDRTVAVKVLNQLAPQSRERFKREAEAMQRVRHNNVVALQDYGILTDGRPFIVMELVSGETLADLLTKQGRLSVEEAISIASSICLALSAAHAANIIHRDLKPGNIILTQKDSEFIVKVVDFGLAKSIHAKDGDTLTVSGDTVGTPQYMSPEQCTGAPLDGRSDLYNLGCILYEMLSGRKVVDHESMYECMHAHLNEPAPDLPDNVKVPRALAEVVRHALSKDPAGRYANAGEMLDALNTVHKRVTFFVNRKHGKLIKFSAIAFPILFVLLFAGIIIVDTFNPDLAQASKVDLRGLKWINREIGRIKCDVPDFQPEFKTEPHDESAALVRRYDLAKWQYIELKEYQNRDLQAEVTLQNTRHSSYKGYRELTPMHKAKFGKENLEGYDSSFILGPGYERHALLSVGPHVYKFKLRSLGRNSQIEAAYERMLSSVMRSY